MTLRRTIRTRPRAGPSAGEVVTTALVSELVDPSPELWLVSGWVSDVPVIDNSGGTFDHLLEGQATAWTLSAVLALLHRRGSRLNLALREDPHNEDFRRRLERLVGPLAFNSYTSPDLHEKLLLGYDWQLSGSMNFTWNGLEVNEEGIEYKVDATSASQQRLELRQRWRGLVT